jgi:uncharacterized caspase-like protein
LRFAFLVRFFTLIRILLLRAVPPRVLARAGVWPERQRTTQWRIARMPSSQAPRSFGLLLALAASLASLFVPARAEARKKYALLVGVKEYDHKKLPNLQFTENDVEALAKVLREEKAGFDSVAVLTSSRGRKEPAAKPTAKNIRAELKKVLGKVTKHDTVLVALSGHGVQVEVEDPRGRGKARQVGFFCPCDARLADIDYLTGRSPSMLGLDELFKQLEDSAAGVNLLLVDACRNELARGEKSINSELIKPASGVAALFSCARGQKSYESNKLGDKGHGLFFFHVLEGLKGEAQNKKGEVTWDRLVAYVKEEVPSAAVKVIREGAQQSPHLVSNLVNSPVLIRKVAPAKQRRRDLQRPSRGRAGLTSEERKTWADYLGKLNPKARKTAEGLFARSSTAKKKKLIAEAKKALEEAKPAGKPRPGSALTAAELKKWADFLKKLTDPKDRKVAEEVWNKAKTPTEKRRLLEDIED